MLQQILVLLLSLSLLISFIITGSHLRVVVVSFKGINDSAKVLQKNDASDRTVLADNVHEAAGKGSKWKISWNKVADKIYSERGSLLTPIQRSSTTTTEKIESPAVVVERKSEQKVRRRSLMVKEKKIDSGFVAYSADYGKPRHHPPKNN